jgi:alcohol dehydrogenase class IV
MSISLKDNNPDFLLNNMQFELLLPKKIIFGAGSVDNVGSDVKILGCENALIVTSPGMRKRDAVKNVIESLTNKKINATIWDVDPEPPIENVYDCMEIATDCDVIIGVGGGSVIDVAKKVAAELATKKIMIPTTAGTGSEVTHESVLKVEGKKRAFVDEHLIPDVAIVDPNLMRSMPPKLIASSGIDALAHAIECYDSRRSNFLVKTLAFKAYEIIKANLRNAVAGNENAIENMALGSLIAGMAFGNSGTALAHALSYPLSNEGAPHGEAVAMVLPYALEFNKFDTGVIQEVKAILRDLKLGRAIKGDVEEMARVVMADTKHLANNPREVRYEDIVAIYEKIRV